jgi:lactoylglutathione lyase
MTRVHVHLHVADLERSRDFYQRFLGVPPIKERPGYYKFLPERAPVNLALSQGGADVRPRVAGHLGVEMDSTADVERELARVRAAGVEVEVERNVDCCFANQDKFWVSDPDGLRWEVYHVNYDLGAEVGMAPRPGKPREAGSATEPAACCGGISGRPAGE